LVPSGVGPPIECPRFLRRSPACNCGR
jgi:hypothetical protein